MKKTSSIWFKLFDSHSRSVRSFSTLASILVTASGLFYSGCAQVPTLHDVSDQGDPTTILMNYEILPAPNTEMTEDCTILFTHLNSNVTYEVPLALNKKIFQVEAPAGKYKVGKLNCGRAGKWDLDSFGTSEITVHEGKVNTLGRFGFEIAHEKKQNELKLIRGDRDDARKALGQTGSRMSPSWRKRVVSAYTGGPIPEGYFQESSTYARGILSHVTGPKVQLSTMNFDTCERNEFKANPAPMGILTYEVTYKNNEWVSTKNIARENSFSENYIQCVEKALKDFKPGNSRKIDYVVRF